MLEAERAKLNEISMISVGSREPVELDQTTQGRLSRMDALQVQEMALEQERRRGLELRRIGAALNRIDTGNYGYCASCGGKIETKRLRHDPSAPLCVTCAIG